jgi:hypothetical protein
MRIRGKTLILIWIVLFFCVLLAPISLYLAFIDSLRLPVILAGLAVAGLLFWRRHMRTGGCCLLMALCLALPWFASGGLPVPKDMKQIKLIVLPSSDRQALDYAVEQRPDLLFIPDFSNETDRTLGVQRVIHADPLATEQLTAALPQLTGLYRPWLLKTSDGMGMFIRQGVTGIDDIRVREAQVGSYALVVDARLEGIEVTLAMVHFTRPYPLAEFGRQVEQVKRLSGQLAEIPRPVILAGDFNALPWSAILTRLSTSMAASNAQWVGTFPAKSPVKLPIDQVRVSGGLQIVSIEAGPFVGSVHLPLIATIALPPR